VPCRPLLRADPINQLIFLPVVPATFLKGHQPEHLVVNVFLTIKIQPRVALLRASACVRKLSQPSPEARFFIVHPWVTGSRPWGPDGVAVCLGVRSEPKKICLQHLP
jgi:hypothetical protein